MSWFNLQTLRSVVVPGFPISMGLQLLVLSCGGKSSAGIPPLPQPPTDTPDPVGERAESSPVSVNPVSPVSPPTEPSGESQPRAVSPAQSTDPEVSTVNDLPPEPVLVTLASTYLPLLEDVELLPVDSRPFTRYIALSTPRRDQQLAVNLLLNATSLAPLPSTPVLLEGEALIRVDLRQFAWDRLLVVGGVEFSDGWEAVVEQSWLGLPNLPQSGIEELFNTATPVLPATAFVAAVASAPLYYALTNAPDTTWDLEEQLEVVRPEFPSSNFFVAGVDPVQHRYQGVRRYTTSEGQPFWQGLPDPPRGNSLFFDPFSFNEWEADAIYVLPNGLPGFLVGPLAGGDTHRDSMPSNQRGEDDQVVASCLGCHFAGAVSVEDLLPAYIADNPYIVAAQDLADIEAFWPTQLQLDAVVEDDSLARLEALATAGLQPQSATAPQRVIQHLEAGLSLDEVARALRAPAASVQTILSEGEFPLTPESLRRRFPQLICQLHPDAASASNYCGQP